LNIKIGGKKILENRRNLSLFLKMRAFEVKNPPKLENDFKWPSEQQLKAKTGKGALSAL